MNIEGRTIRLRAVEPDDIERMYLWENDCAVWPVSGTTEPFSRYQMQRFVEQQQDAGIFRTGQLRLIIETLPAANGGQDRSSAADAASDARAASEEPGAEVAQAENSTQTDNKGLRSSAAEAANDSRTASAEPEAEVAQAENSTQTDNKGLRSSAAEAASDARAASAEPGAEDAQAENSTQTDNKGLRSSAADAANDSRTASEEPGAEVAQAENSTQTDNKGLRSSAAEAASDLQTAPGPQSLAAAYSGEAPRAVGAVDLFEFDPVSRRAGVGILIYELSDRGRGYAADTLETLCRYVRDTLDMHQLWCNVGTDNEASLALFRRAGFTPIGVKRDWQWRDGHYHDEAMLQKILDI